MSFSYDERKDPVENKWGYESRSYYDFADSKIEHIGSVREYFSNSNKLSIGFAADKEAAIAKQLLEKAGFKDVRIEEKSVSVYEQDGKGLAAFAAALATTHDLGRGQTLFAVLERADAREIIAKEVETDGLSFQQAGLIDISVMTLDNSDGQRYGTGVASQSYKSAYLNDMGPIANIREFDSSSSFIGRYTQITASDNMGHIVAQKLAAKFIVERAENSPHMRIKQMPGGLPADLSSVAEELAANHLISKRMANEIAGVQPAAPVAAAPVPQSPKAAGLTR